MKGDGHSTDPWSVRVHAAVITVRSANGEPLALMLTRRPDEDLPNARMMAASPTMLEALFNILASARLIPDPAMNGATDCYGVALDDIEAIRAVIARVEGGSCRDG